MIPGNRIATGLGAACGIALIMAAAGPASADDLDGSRWDFGLFGGYHFTSETNELGVADVENPDAFDDSWGLGLRVGYAFMRYISAEGEAAFLPTDTIRSETDVMPIGLRVHGLAHFMGPENAFRPFAVAGLGALVATATDVDILDHDTDLALHAGVGFKLRLGERWGVRVDGRIMFPPSTEDEGPTTDFELWAGLTWTFGDAAPADRDGDGIPDDRDQCPDQPENVNGIEDEDGCPEDGDPDNDGILGAADQCPTDPEDPDGFQDEDGCPDEDNDGDGIADAQDQCPNEPETANGIDDQDGCPEGDEDGDGIVGSNDQCPSDPEDKDGFQDEDGCPDPDNDGDGVPDAQDKCPDEKETMNGYEDEDGCADEVPKAVKRFSGTIKGIRFRVNSAVIQRSSFRTLDAAVKVLNEYPSVRLEIQGHTDSQGPDEYNMKLSQDRADSVKTYLVSKGIDDTRLTAKGYGETQPIADNNTSAGRQQNRRVEFKLVSGGAPAGASATQPSQPEAASPEGEKAKEVEAPKSEESEE